MKHIFVINPSAGRRDSTASVSQKVEAYAGSHEGFDYELYVTRRTGDATAFVEKRCREHPLEEVRYYSCGGDGTLNEVVTGVLKGGADPEKVQVTVHANGSGNDYIKYYGQAEDFNDLERLVEGEAHPVDVMKVEERYSINVCNFGFDAMVCKIGNDVRRKPIIGGKNSYTTGIIRSIFTSRSNYVKMEVDGEPFFDGKMLLTTLGNGRYNGGCYMCSPLSKNDDGLMEVNLLKPMRLVKFASLINDYKQGTHIERREAQDLILYRRAARVDITSKKPFWLVVDGEMMHSDHYHVENLKQAITFVAPRPSSP